MDYIKKILLILFGLLFLPALASAFGELVFPAAPSLATVIINVVNALWIVFVGVAIACFIFAGIMFALALGDPEKIKTAKNAVIFGVIGIVVAIIAFSIVSIMKVTFGA